MKNIAIIPARSGSKGLLDKNIRVLNGKPLLAYSIKAAKDSEMFDEVMVSTDSEKYRKIALDYGASVPFLRTIENSTDFASSWNVVIEVLSKYFQLGQTYDTVCLLQPTSPLRKAEDIVESYNLFIKKKAFAITSVCEVDHSPLWTMTLGEDLSLDEFRKNLSSLPRQRLNKYYRLNGAIYIRSIQYIGNTIQIIHSPEFAFIMDRRRSVDIDTIDDFELGEFYLNKSHI